MEEKDPRGVVEGLVLVLRRITRVVQLLPFVYLFGYITLLVIYNLKLPDIVLCYLDAFFYVSPIMVASHLIYSSILKLCSWHKVACATPLVSPLLLTLDSIINFGVGTAILFNMSAAIMILLFIVSAYKVFANQ